MSDPATDADEQDMRIGAPRAVSALLAPLTRRALGKHGFSAGALISEWDVIVGPELAATCQPVKLAFRKGERDGGVLHLNVSGGAALEIQHIGPQIIERINGHLGYRAVGRLKLVHGLMGRSRGARWPNPRPAAPPPPVDPGHWPALEGITDPALRESLLRLGAAIAARESDAKK
jgi:hypothetical protein